MPAAQHVDRSHDLSVRSAADPTTGILSTRAPVAQWIERWVPDPKVAGSSPVGRASTNVLFAGQPPSHGRRRRSGQSARPKWLVGYDSCRARTMHRKPMWAVDAHSVDRALLRIPVVGSHPEGSAWDPDHVFRGCHRRGCSHRSARCRTRRRRSVGDIPTDPGTERLRRASASLRSIAASVAWATPIRWA